MTSLKSDFQITCRNVWKVFGPHPKELMHNLDPGLSKADILTQTGHVVAVKNVSFGVRKGETFVVMGLSGSGKSTLVRCISRLIEPTSGQVLLDGKNILTMDQKHLRELRRHKMSMVFQHFGLFPHRQIIDNVAYGLEIQGVQKSTRRTRAGEVLDMVGLGGWENHYPNELSGGMQQRVGIARALAVDPEILLFDEPFSALDPLIRREMQDELINLQKLMQKTIIFITHDFLEAVKLGDHIAIMNDGEIVQIGTPAEVVMRPINNYVREFTKDVPRDRVVNARSIMNKQPPVVAATASKKNVELWLNQQKCPALFVENEQGRFLGILLPEQADAGIRSNKIDVNSLLTDHPTVAPDTLLADLIEISLTNTFPLPVVDDHNKLLGTIDQASVMLALSSRSNSERR